MLENERKSMLMQRRILGILCISLGPCSLLFGLFGLGTNYPNWYLSISDTYYANSRMFMMGLLFAISVFFFAYKGYDKHDRIVSLIEAICAIMIVAFPCDPLQEEVTRTGLFNLPVKLSQIIHASAAFVMFITYGYNVLFLFTKNKGEKTEKKILRNIIYCTSGTIIWIGIALQTLFVLNSLKIPDTIPFTMINEIVMLFAFGGAYLVKSEALKCFND